jgi:hypothetical protein
MDKLRIKSFNNSCLNVFIKWEDPIEKVILNSETFYLKANIENNYDVLHQLLNEKKIRSSELTLQGLKIVNPENIKAINIVEGDKITPYMIKKELKSEYLFYYDRDFKLIINKDTKIEIEFNKIPNQQIQLASYLSCGISTYYGFTDEEIAITKDLIILH